MSWAWETKMLRPEPAYFVCSLLASKSRRSVGSRLLAAWLFLLVPGPDARRGIGRVGSPDVLEGVAAPGAVKLEDEDGENSYATTATAITPSTIAQIVFFRFFAPNSTTRPPLNTFQLSLAT